MMSFDPVSNKIYNVSPMFLMKIHVLITGTGISDPTKITKVTRRISKIDSDLHPNLNISLPQIFKMYI